VATNNLAKVKGLALFTKKFMELGQEKIFLIQNNGSWTIIRAKEINKRIDEGDYDKVFNIDPYALQEIVIKTERLSPNKTLCPGCGHELVWIEQYQRWYCYGCNKHP
jgi:ribosomal protein S27AE